ncbi:hypothetical protein AVEN_129053-1, partial [Araneus ventricosus]
MERSRRGGRIQDNIGGQNKRLVKEGVPHHLGKDDHQLDIE